MTKIEDTISSVSIFLTNKCNLNCKHCFIKGSPQNNQFLTWPKIKTALDYYRRQNYQIVEFTGGEALLSPYIIEAVKYAKKIGIPKIGINTNGVSPFINNHFTPKDLFKITYSIDGATKETHDYIRGKNTFNLTIKNLKNSIKAGFRTEVIYTVNKINIHQTIKAIHLLDNLGVKKISFNCISNMGNTKNNQNILIKPIDWIKTREKIAKIKQLKNASLRYPLMFVHKKNLSHLINNGYRCVLRNSFKTDIRPDGKIFHCCLIADHQNLSGGQVFNNKIIFDDKKEIKFIEKFGKSSCPAIDYLLNNHKNQTKDDIVPICLYWKKISG